MESRLLLTQVRDLFIHSLSVCLLSARRFHLARERDSYLLWKIERGLKCQYDSFIEMPVSSALNFSIDWAYPRTADDRASSSCGFQHSDQRGIDRRQVTVMNKIWYSFVNTTLKSSRPAKQQWEEQLYHMAGAKDAIGVISTFSTLQST